jgi:hypothetical protein
MSIMQHSAPEQWMVALVGLTHMVPSAVDNGRQRIMVFEGNEDIRADLLSWLQTKQTSSVPVRRTTRATARDADEGDGTSSEQSPASEDTALSRPVRVLQRQILVLVLWKDKLWTGQRMRLS